MNVRSISNLIRYDSSFYTNHQLTPKLSVVQIWNRMQDHYTINISDKVRREERNKLKIIQVKPEEEKGLGNGKITISNNNDIEDTRNVIRNTTKRGDKSKR